jgi:hypothetical protein
MALLAFELNGEGGIRTLVKVAPKQHFQCCAFNRSATSPGGCNLLQGHQVSIVADPRTKVSLEAQSFFGRSLQGDWLALPTSQPPPWTPA